MVRKFLPILILLSACQKEEITKPAKSSELHAVSFELSGFTRHSEPMNVKLKSGNAAFGESDDPYDPSRPCYPDCPGSRYDYDLFLKHELRYYAYDEETGELVGSQRSDYANGENENYGSFTDSLPAGTYDIVFVMCQGEVNGYDWGNAGPAVFYGSDFNEATVTAHVSDGGGADFTVIGAPDIFFKHMKLTVAGEVAMDDIELPRVVGGIELRLTDEQFPDDLYYISTKHHTHNQFGFSGGARSPGLAHYPYYNIAQTDSGYHMFQYIIPDTETGKLTTDVEIIAFRRLDDYPYADTIAHEVIHNVEIEMNKKTILTGELFDHLTPTQAFTVEIDSAWTDGEIIEF